MPELPEVETVKNVLLSNVLDAKIINVEINYDRIIQNIEPLEFASRLRGEVIRDIKRRGKYLLFILDNYILISHLRMEGKYYIRDIDDELFKHEHVIFDLEDGRSLRYHDTRKFGVMYLYDTISCEEVLKLEPLKRLGVEPFSDDLTVEYLKTRFIKTKRPIKTVLLDQSIISGLGNIYVNEVLFLSKIHPLTPANLLKDNQIKDIITCTIDVLNKAISLGGTTIHSFESSLEVSGRFQNELRVHMQEVCSDCHSKITKIFVGQRGTYFCEICQSNKY